MKFNNYYDRFNDHEKNVDNRKKIEKEFNKLLNENFYKQLKLRNIKRGDLSNITGYTPQNFAGIYGQRDEDKSKGLSVYSFYRLLNILKVPAEQMFDFDSSLKSPNDEIEAKKHAIVMKLQNLNNDELLNIINNQLDGLLNIQKSIDTKNKDENEHQY